jgi:hypothetical protein
MELLQLAATVGAIPNWLAYFLLFLGLFGLMWDLSGLINMAKKYLKSRIATEK